jgi:hypothetical protein
MTEQIEAIRVTPDAWAWEFMPAWLVDMRKGGYLDESYHPKAGHMVALLSEDGSYPIPLEPGEWIVRMHDLTVHVMPNETLEDIVQQRIDPVTVRLTVNLETEQ